MKSRLNKKYKLWIIWIQQSAVKLHIPYTRFQSKSWNIKTNEVVTAQLCFDHWRGWLATKSCNAVVEINNFEQIPPEYFYSIAMWIDGLISVYSSPPCCVCSFKTLKCDNPTAIPNKMHIIIHTHSAPGKR